MKSTRLTCQLTSIAACAGALCLLGAPALLTPGCSTTSGASGLAQALSTPQAQAALGSAETILGSVATNYLAAQVAKETGAKGVQPGQAASAALWNGVGTLVSSGQIQQLLSSFQLPGSAKAAASAFSAANPQTPAQAAQVTNAIASVVSTAAGAPPAPAPVAGSKVAAAGNP